MAHQIQYLSLALRFALFAGIAVCAQFAEPAWAAVIYVKADATGANNGHSWTDAYTNPQAALAAAASGDEIWVARGTYKPTTGTDRALSFPLKSGVGLYGGFAGTEAERQQRDSETNTTILCGDIGTTDTADNSYHVVVGADLAVLDGFTISGGNANGSNPMDRGGGMHNVNGSPTVANCTFTGNTAVYGGGIYNDRGFRLTVTKCTFRGNKVVSTGAGICNWMGSSTVTNCTFSGNTAGCGGAGMYNYGMSQIVTSCAFNGNTASGDGDTRNDFGGGMYNEGCSPTVTNCAFSGNTAGGCGGGMFNSGGSPTVTNCTFSGNTASLGGGGMFSYYRSPTVTNCIFWDNNAPSGSEVHKSSGTPTFSHCDIKGSGGSGALWDTALGADGGANIGGDPRFVAPATPAGPDGLWRTRDDGLRLRSDSPCIGAADPVVAPITDILGLPRATAPDIGAYEYYPIVPASADPVWLLFRQQWPYEQ